MNQTVPSIRVEQMREVDRLMMEDYGIGLLQMMENAGRSLAEMAVRMMGFSRSAGRAVVLCGKGNNGGGGMVAARHLHSRGYTVSAVLVGEGGKSTETANMQWNILDGLGITGGIKPRELNLFDLIVDAIIGYGLEGNPRGAAAVWIEAANSSQRPILSLDIPSGLDGDTGRIGEPCIQASTTLTLALPKTGLFGPEAEGVRGTLYLADISVPPKLYDRIGVWAPADLFKDEQIVQLD